jgi:HrpA-like RNA helicase
LITGETGCGKSTQVPRILYEYMKAVKLPGKVLCVEPRRLAAMNLTKILGDQVR